jgi:hypothetical protein
VLACALLTMTRPLAATGRFDDADGPLREALPLIRAHGYRVLEVDALTLRARIDAALGRPDPARAATRAAADLRRSLRLPTVALRRQA